jgi:mannosyltransferase
VVGGRISQRENSVWASAIQSPYTGLGIFQRKLYSGLERRGIKVVSPVEPRKGALRVAQSFARVIRPPSRAALVCATPAPFRSRVPVISFVYDLRWQRTRGFWTRMYNYLDLRRTVNRAQHIFAISARTRDDLIALFPHAASKSSVLHLGPGIMGGGEFTDGEPGTVLLAGLAGYKRNELIAQAVAWSRPTWAHSFLCVGVSDSTFRILSHAFGETACERFERIDDTLMSTLFQRADVYITGSMEEGFGLPMVEALVAGCQVVAVRQPVTLEVLGDAGVLIDDGDFIEIGDQLQRPKWAQREVRLARASIYSWDRVADEVAAVIGRLP